MAFDLVFFLVAAPAVAFAGISKGGFGSGAAFAATPLLALVVEPDLALGFMLPLLLVIDAATLKPYWRAWSGREARLLVLGALPGMALGAAFLGAANPDILRLLLGVISLAFVVWHAGKLGGWIPQPRHPLSATTGLMSGAAAGFTSFVSHAGGPVVAIYLLAKGLSKTAYQATTVIVFAAINLLKLAAYAGMGLVSAETLWAGLPLVPAALLGAWIGVKAHRAIPERLFFGIVLVLLTLTGLKLLWDAVI